MKIILVATHSFPIPYKTHTGDIVILDLADTLADLGHDVSIAAPEGTQPINKNVKVLKMRASYGAYPPSARQCEEECFNNYVNEFNEADIVHDFSVEKTIVTQLNKEGKKSTVCTLMGGAWTHSYPPNNLVVWSNAHRERVLRGATDYENTPTPDLAGPPQKSVNDAHVVYGGIDTNWYTPTYKKDDFFLWMNRWHPAKGYHKAIELAKATGIKLVMAGEHPDREMFDYQKQCAIEAVNLSAGATNIHFEWLPADPHHHEMKRELYRKAKALLYTVQFQEPFGLSQVESLSCGTPVIGINFGSVPEVIVNGITGFVVKNNIEDLKLAATMINNINPQVCREDAVTKFDKKVMAEKYIEQYQYILNGQAW